MYNIVLEKQAIKDFKHIERTELKYKVAELLRLIHNNPFQNPPHYKKLKGHNNRYSRRINKRHRLVYEIYEGSIIKIVSMWTHYENI